MSNKAEEIADLLEPLLRRLFQPRDNADTTPPPAFDARDATIPGPPVVGARVHPLVLAVRRLEHRLENHAKHINTLHDDEATTRNMAIHAENLVAEAEARMSERIEAAEERIRQRLDVIAQGAREAADD